MVKNLGFLVFALVGFASSASADVFTVPPGLAPGDTYRLVFLTSTTTVAASSNINYYNSFVTNTADSVPALAALNATWTAIASTEFVDAATNIGASTSGIYLLNGTEVAASTAALFNTFHTPLDAPINVDENGNGVPETAVWTGTDATGSGEPGFELGVFGVAGDGDNQKTNSLAFFQGHVIEANQFPMYAISSVLTVPVAVPEPSTGGLIALVLAALLLELMRRKKSSANR